MQALLVGCGAMARGWVQAIQESPRIGGRVSLAGLVDLDASTRATFAKAHGLSDLPGFASIAQALGQITPDVVFDVTPPAVRADVVRAALGAGVHVLSEKPMANSMAEARELAALATETGRRFTITQNRRYKPGPRRIAAFLQAGGLGTVTGIHADFFLGPHFGGFREEMDHVLLLDMAIHHFDAARFMTGQTAQSVTCLETNPEGSWYGHGASAYATFQMTGDVVFTYRGSWCAEGVPTAWDAAWRITGTKGTLVWDGADRVEAEVVTGRDGFLRETQSVPVPELEDDRDAQEHASVIAAFLDAIAAGTAPETDSQDNLKSLAMVFAAIKSAQTGQPVDMEQDPV